MDPITIAMGLAQFAPGIIKLLTGSDKAETVANKVIEIAQTVTGAGTPAQALAQIQTDPIKVMEFQQAFAEREASLELAYLADVQNARGRDVELAKSGLTNHRANGLTAGAGALVIGCLLVTVWASAMDDFAKATVTLICGRALGWVEQVFSFEFGTTRANKTKDDTINNLTK